jgi:tetratricopeptide (TPR) repeat protein
VSDYFAPGSTTKSAEAYDLYLRGIRDVDTYNREAVLRAISAFSKAVEYDPVYVNAWVGLADAYDIAATTRYLPPGEAYHQARLAAEKALSLDPMNAGAYATRAFVRMNLWDWQGAEEDIRRSLEIRKTSSGLQAAGNLAAARGDLTGAERQLVNVLALDPLDPFTITQLAYQVYPSLSRFDDADRFYLKLKDLDANFPWFNAGRSFVEVQEGHYPVALQLAEKETDAEARETALAIVYFAMRKPDQSEQALGRLLRMGSSEYSAALVYAYRGEKDLAFRSLEAAVQGRRPDLTNLKADPLLATLRTDERYRGLLRRMNLPE